MIWSIKYIGLWEHHLGATGKWKKHGLFQNSVYIIFYFGIFKNPKFLKISSSFGHFSSKDWSYNSENVQKVKKNSYILNLEKHVLAGYVKGLERALPAQTSLSLPHQVPTF